MPYILTTYNGDKEQEYRVETQVAMGIATRTAVATLDEARKRCYDVLIEKDNDPAPHFDAHFAVDNMDESGGTVRLPDNTVIEVQETGWLDLARDSGIDAPVAVPKLPANMPAGHAVTYDAILAAFNNNNKE